MRRWLERLKKLRFDDEQNYSTNLFVDYFYAFFQTCYHLRDYLSCTENIKLELDELFKQSMPLKACRDICNGTKHLDITRPSIDAHFSIYRNYVPVAFTTTPYPRNEQWKIFIGNDDLDVLELAKSCVNDWTNFLLSQKLLEKNGDKVKFIDNKG